MMDEHKHYVLEEHAGQFIVNGKPFYPAYVSIRLTKRTAFELIQQLALQLSDSERDIAIHLVGTLSQEADE